jgi:hypothetical protein
MLAAANERGTAPGPGFHATDRSMSPVDEDLRRMCRDVKFDPSRVSFKLVGNGKMGMILKVGSLCLKTGRIMDRDSKVVGGSLPVASNIPEFELDMCRMLSNLLFDSGMCPHTCHVRGMTYMCPSQKFDVQHGYSKAMIMDALQGVRVGGKPRPLYDLSSYLRTAVYSPLEAIRFGQVIKTAMFQAAFFLYTVSTALDGCFRHNDLHAGNVGLEELSVSLTRTYEVVLLRDGGKTVANSVTISGRVNSAVLDFGYAALLYPLALQEDAATLHQTFAKRDLEVMQGMSSVRKCAYYDLFLLLSSVRAELRVAMKNRDELSNFIPTATQVAIDEFMQFYHLHFGFPEKVWDGASPEDLPYVHKCFSRLTDTAQEMAAQMCGAFLTGDASGVKTWKKLLTPAEFLSSEYFACFEASQKSIRGDGERGPHRPAGSSESVVGDPVACATAACILGPTRPIDKGALMAVVKSHTNDFFRALHFKSGRGKDKDSALRPTGQKTVVQTSLMSSTISSLLASTSVAEPYFDMLGRLVDMVNGRGALIRRVCLVSSNPPGPPREPVASVCARVGTVRCGDEYVSDEEDGGGCCGVWDTVADMTETVIVSGPGPFNDECEVDGMVHTVIVTP